MSGKYEEFLKAGAQRVKLSTTADSQLYEQAMKILKQNKRKFSEFVDHSLKLLIEEHSKSKGRK